MKLFTFLFVFYFSFSFAQAQSDSLTNKSYILSNITDTIKIKEKGYYLLKINDLRVNKKNLGSIKFKSEKQYVTTRDSLPVYLSNLFYPQSASDSLKPLIINIEKLRTFASTNGNIDQGELYIKMNAQTFQRNTTVVIYNFERTFTYQKKAKPEFLKTFIFNSLSTSIDILPSKIQTERNKQAISKNPDEPLNKENIHIINLPERFIASTPGFYVNEVIDHRLDQSNEGNVYQGYFNRNAVAKLDSGLVKYLSTVLKTDSITYKKPATLHVYDFRCNENLSNLNEKATFSFKAKITIDSLQKKYFIHNASVKTDTFIDGDITKLWPQIISKGLLKYFNNFPSEKIIVPVDSVKNTFLEEITVKQGLKKNYFYQEDELKKLSEFNYIFSKSTDDSLKLIYNRGKILTRTGRSFMGIGAGMFIIPVLDFMRYEGPSLKQWYNDERSNTNGTVWFGKKTLVQSSIAVFASGLLLKWIGKSLITKSVSRYNKAIFEKVSLNLNPNINNSGYTFKLEIMLGQAK
ncbi:MAG: hypothetical protein H7329_11805 [Opitutaceae bacterium]|nr:hypothetical protein [Cytophagales bacterium]